MGPDPFDRIEALMKMVPLSRLQCPKCKGHGEDDFELIRTVRLRTPMSSDGPSKIATPDYTLESLEDVLSEKVRCVCGEEFPLPNGWRLGNRQKTRPADPADAVDPATIQKQEQLRAEAKRRAADKKWGKPTQPLPETKKGQ